MGKIPFSALVLLCASALGQTTSAVPVPLPPVDVPVPEAAPAPSSVTRTTPSGVVTLIDTAAHRGEAKDTAELLAPTPGVVISDSGGLGQRKSLSLRGAGSTGVMVLLDGIPLSSPGSSVDLSRIPAAIIEKLEVLRGASSARYGPGALGGVVNILTQRPQHGATVAGEATWGSFGTALGSVTAAGDLLGGDGLLLVHGARSDGNFGFLYDAQPALTGNALTPMVRRNNQASAGGGLARYERTLSSHLALEVLAEGGADGRQLAGTAQNPTLDASDSAVHGLLGARLTGKFHSGGELTALGWGRLEDVTLVGAPCSCTGSWHQVEGGAGVDLSFSQLAFTRHGLSASASVATEWLRSPSQTRPSWVRAGLMVGDEVFLFDGMLAINATVRVDQSGPFTGFSPRAGALLLLPEGFELRANLGQAHRPPTFLELYVKQGHLAPNPELRPERALSADAAVAFRRDSGFVQVGGFGALYEDLISYEYYPPQLARPYNFAAARVFGLEAEGTIAPTPWLAAAASYTFMATQNQKDDPRFYGRQLPYRPQHKLGARVSAGPLWLRGHGEVLYQSEQFTNRTESVVIPARTFVNVGLSTKPLARPDLTVSLELKNLLDVQSQDLDGYPLPSRGAYLTLSIATSFTKEPHL